jgi:hypothetical protein
MGNGDVVLFAGRSEVAGIFGKFKESKLADCNEVWVLPKNQKRWLYCITNGMQPTPRSKHSAGIALLYIVFVDLIVSD